MATAEKSDREYRQARASTPKSTSEVTATIIAAARAALGKKNKIGVNSKAARAIPIAARILATGVRAPESKLTTDLEKPPVTGKPADTAEATFAAPSAISS